MEDLHGGEVWTAGRKEIMQELDRTETTDVLLGYGTQLATGSQRQHHRAQIAWLFRTLESSGHRVWTFGGRPSHPSRWQRVVHHHSPGGSVEALAGDFLLPAAPGTLLGA